MPPRERRILVAGQPTPALTAQPDL